MILSISIGMITLVGFAFMIYRSYSEPNKKQDEEIAVGNATCELRHKGIDEKFLSINNEIVLIKENHLKHIENDVKNLQLGQERILTILDERLPKKS